MTLKEKIVSLLYNGIPPNIPAHISDSISVLTGATLTVDSGGTLCNAADALISKGATSVSAYITHGILSGQAHEKITNSKLKNLVITNSIEPTKETLSSPNIKIIDISDLLAKAINNGFNIV